MNLSMPTDLAAAYKSGSQRARVVTEFWAENNLYCPNCSSPKLDRLIANTKASDFSCPACGFWYQLKGQQTRLGNSITDGAYAAMMSAIRNDETPNFYFMHYQAPSLSRQSLGDGGDWTVKNLLLIPHFAFPPSAIIKRKALSETARRAGWIGCNIALNLIPPDARIQIVRTVSPPSLPSEAGGEGRGEEAQSRFSGPRGSHRSGDSPERRHIPSVLVTAPEEVRAQFRKIKPLKEIPITQRGWMLDVLNIIRRLANERATGNPRPSDGRGAGGEGFQFTNQDIYAFETHFKKLHPDNHFIRDKIRQQLQNLARAGLLIHAGRNDYRLK